MLNFFRRLLDRIEGRARNAEARVLEDLVSDFTSVSSRLRDHAANLRELANKDFAEAQALVAKGQGRANQAVKASRIAGNIDAIVNPKETSDTAPVAGQGSD